MHLLEPLGRDRHSWRRKTDADHQDRNDQDQAKQYSNGELEFVPSACFRYVFDRHINPHYEKSQQNHFLADWLEHCLKSGRSTAPLPAPGS